MRRNLDQPDCRCPDTATMFNATLQGTTPANPCPIHDPVAAVAAAQVEAARAEADRHRGVLAAFRAETAAAVPEADPPVPLKVLLERVIVGEDDDAYDTPPGTARPVDPLERRLREALGLPPVAPVRTPPTAA